MSEAIASIITGAMTLVGVVITVWLGNKKTQDLVEYQIQELQKKVEQHNGVVSRTAILENDMKTVKADIREIRNVVNRND